ncbi:PIN domain-containing protein [Candidatus Woesearchaeota archaeon]|nr:PIN domain-containing protein [Candidatus Woesearchaeota archaeon]
MVKESYYVDSCIWLNLFKKEGDPSKGMPYWKIAEEFFKKVTNNRAVIIISPVVLKEISYKLQNKFSHFKNYILRNTKDIEFIDLMADDYRLARKLELINGFQIGFSDYLHVAICKRLNLILITRDRKLIAFAQKHICVLKPEDLFF